MTEMETSMAMEMTKYYEDELRDETSEAVEAAEPKKRSAPLRMSRDDAHNVLRELRKYPKKSADKFATKKEVLEIIRPGIEEMIDKKGYNEREIVGILRKLKTYNYTAKEISVALGTRPPDRPSPQPPDYPVDGECQCEGSPT